MATPKTRRNRRIWWLLSSPLLIAYVLIVVWWLRIPSPGESVFKDWVPTRVGRTWTIVGDPGSKYFALVDTTGAIQPRRDSYSIHFFLYDRDNRKLYSPLLKNVRGRRSLTDGCILTLDWKAGDLSVGQSVFAEGNTCYSTITLMSSSRELRHVALFAAAVPYILTGPMGPSREVTYDERSSSILIDDMPLLISDWRPASGAVTAIELPDDITSYIRRGGLPAGISASPKGMRATSAGLCLDVVLAPGSFSQYSFRSPLTPGIRDQISSLDSTKALAALRGDWQRLLDRVKPVSVSKRSANCYYANVSYLTTLCAEGLPMPGPTKYRSFWVRDCAYFCDALAAIGRDDLVVPALKQLVSMQSADGGFPPKLGSKEQNELDAPGETIYALVQQYRRTNDRQWLSKVWPCIRKAGVYIRNTRGPDGIMPASFSAEDLGSGTEQHYWDDFWCIRGLRDAAFAAKEFGKASDARWLAAEAESLRAATFVSIRKTMAKAGISYIPNGPQEWKTAAAARGTSCGLWPCEVLDPNDPLVRKSFDAYWNKWIAPSGGGFVFRDHYWPYAGLDLAHGYIMLGQSDRARKIVRWTVNHDPTGGWYSYPEGMSRKDLSLAEGDMPHGWFSASYIILVQKIHGNQTVSPE